MKSRILSVFAALALTLSTHAGLVWTDSIQSKVDELRIRNGVHNWEYWHTALRTALPFASRNFSR